MRLHLRNFIRYSSASIFLIALLAFGQNCTSSNLGGSGLFPASSSSSSSTGTPGNPTIPPVIHSAICASPISLVDTSTPDVIVGSGTASSCTQTSLQTALNTGGKINFNCGSSAVTIPISSQLTLLNTKNTTIDGKNLITLDGQGITRILYYAGTNFQVTTTTVTIQNMIFINGKSTGPLLPSAPAPCSQGYDVPASGGGIYFKDGILRVINSTFTGNQGATPGPDVAGGAIYTFGALETTISGSTFTGNSGANGGAIGSLFGNLSVYNSTFTGNVANGSGANNIDTSHCSVNGGEVGNGGNGGAIVIDGAENFTVNVCGSSFNNNAAGVGGIGGAMFRTPDGSMQSTNIDRTTFDGNTATNGSGGTLYFHNSNLTITNSTISNSFATNGGGGLFIDGSILNFTNDTFFNNVSASALGGAMVIFGNSGTFKNLTFRGNRVTGGSGFFGAAIGGFTAITITNTLFMDNTTADCSAPMACQTSGIGSGNLQWPSVHSVCNTADVLCTPGTLFKDPMLSTLLSDNGGPTKTILPLNGSSAIGGGTNCPATDQRGKARPVTGCTIGAVE